MKIFFSVKKIFYRKFDPRGADFLHPSNKKRFIADIRKIFKTNRNKKVQMSIIQLICG
jgi:hypothetical protein